MWNIIIIISKQTQVSCSACISLPTHLIMSKNGSLLLFSLAKVHPKWTGKSHNYSNWSCRLTVSLFLSPGPLDKYFTLQAEAVRLAA